MPSLHLRQPSMASCSASPLFAASNALLVHPQALRERLKHAEGSLTERSDQLSESERERLRLQQASASSGSSSDEQRRMLAELKEAQKAANTAESRAMDAQRRLEVAQAKQSELQAEIARLMEQLRAAQQNEGLADEAMDLRSRLQNALDMVGKMKRDVEGEEKRAREATERAERAEMTSREQANELQRARKEAQRASAQSKAEDSAERLRLQVSDDRRLTPSSAPCLPHTHAASPIGRPPVMC